MSLLGQILKMILLGTNIKFDTVEIDFTNKIEQYEPWFAKISPDLSVPVLDYKGQIMQCDLETIRHIYKYHDEYQLTLMDMAGEV